MLRDTQDSDFLPIHERQLNLLQADIHLLNSEFNLAKTMYRNALSLPNEDKQTAHILNNLAYACWQHKIELQKKETIPELTDEKVASAKDELFIVPYFKEAI